MDAFRLKTRRSFLSTLALSVLFALTGCDTTGAFLATDESRQCAELPCQVVATWQPNVMFTPDPTHNGAPTPGIAGRVYLFGPEAKFPLVGDGMLIVGLFDDTPRPGDGGPLQMEEWRIDAETFKRLLKKDIMGWGYTVFLPWATYRPDISRVQMKVRYQCLAGYKLTDGSLATLHNAGVPEGDLSRLFTLKDKPFENLDLFRTQVAKAVPPGTLEHFLPTIVSSAEQYKTAPLYADSGPLTLGNSTLPDNGRVTTSEKTVTVKPTPQNGSTSATQAMKPQGR